MYWSVGFEWKLFTRAHIEFKRQSQISVRQRRIWGRNFKTKLLTFSVFSCFFRFSVRLCCMDNWIKTGGRKQENTEKVRSLVLKFLPKILLCLMCSLLIAFISMPPWGRIELTSAISRLHIAMLKLINLFYRKRLANLFGQLVCFMMSPRAVCLISRSPAV